MPTIWYGLSACSVSTICKLGGRHIKRAWCLCFQFDYLWLWTDRIYQTLQTKAHAENVSVYRLRLGKLSRLRDNQDVAYNAIIYVCCLLIVFYHRRL